MIKIVAISYNNESLPTTLSAVFDSRPRGIGRNGDNFFVLPDPKHYVSRFQASVWSKGGQHYLINLSLANPILINDQEITPEREYSISQGDHIQIGLYRLRVDALRSNTPARPTKQISKSVLSPKKQITKTEASVTPDLAATLTPPNYLLRRESDSQALNEVRFSAGRVQPNTSSRLSATPDVAIKTVDTPLGEDELLSALLAGAGLPNLRISSGLTPQLMQTIGQILKSLIEGSMELIAQRALLKREVCSELTMVVLEKNNPMKFFPDSSSVLTQMLGKNIPGFMTPDEAITDSFLDLKTHQSGLVAGMKAELNGLLQQLQPANFSKNLPHSKLMERINPALKKASMWDSFSAHHEQLSQLAKTDTLPMYGKYFQSAYEKTLDCASQTKRH